MIFWKQVLNQKKLFAKILKAIKDEKIDGRLKDKRQQLKRAKQLAKEMVVNG